MGEYARQIARESLKIGAIKLRPEQPFQWASGYRMPIYNDNRMLLFVPRARRLVTDAFVHTIREERLPLDFVAGTSTAGIPWASFISEALDVPMIYIRDEPKGHGMQNQIEGIDVESDLEGRAGPVIEDLISTGGSSAGAVQAVRDANGRADHCISIFSYGLDAAAGAFSALEPECHVHSLLTYDELLDVAIEIGYLEGEELSLLCEWGTDPFSWGEKHGFPRGAG